MPRARQSNIDAHAWGPGAHMSHAHRNRSYLLCTECCCARATLLGVDGAQKTCTDARAPVPQARRCAFAGAHSCLAALLLPQRALRRSCCDGFRRGEAHSRRRQGNDARRAHDQKWLAFAVGQGEVRIRCGHWQERSMRLAVMCVALSLGLGKGFRRTRTAAPIASTCAGMRTRVCVYGGAPSALVISMHLRVFRLPTYRRHERARALDAHASELAWCSIVNLRQRAAQRTVNDARARCRRLALAERRGVAARSALVVVFGKARTKK